MLHKDPQINKLVHSTSTAMQRLSEVLCSTRPRPTLANVAQEYLTNIYLLLVRYMLNKGQVASVGRCVNEGWCRQFEKCLNTTWMHNCNILWFEYRINLQLV